MLDPSLFAVRKADVMADGRKASAGGRDYWVPWDCIGGPETEIQGEAEFPRALQV